VVGAHGLPLRFRLSQGQASDKASLPALLDGLRPARHTIADRGYDALAILNLIRAHGSTPHSTASATWSNASSTSSSISVGSPHATTNSRQTSSPP